MPFCSGVFLGHSRDFCSRGIAYVTRARKEINHKNYNFLYCDWFTCQVVIGQFVIGQFVIGQFVIGQFNKPITFKVVV